MHFGFNTAVHALLASQRSLYITNHNVSNLNTKGYSRQQGEQIATTPYNLAGVGYLGTGTKIYNIERVRDSYVDFKYWNENAPKGEWIIKRDTLSEIEKLFGEPSDSSFRQYLDDFYTALDNMSKNSSDFSFREPVKENALALTKHINETSARLKDLKMETEVSIDAKIRKVNSIATQIASLNRQIYSNELDGRPANDLRDRRDLLVDEMSQIVNVRVDESTSGKFRVSIGGISIVDHIDVNAIKQDVDNKENIVVKWSNGSKVNLKTGELKGLLDLYNGDGKDNSYRGIPYYQRKLNDFALGFAKAFNRQHRKGYSLEGNVNDPTGEGIDFFAYSSDDDVASTITLSDKIMTDLNNIAAAENYPGNADDNRNLLKLIALRDDKNFFQGLEDNQGNPIELPEGTPDDFLKSIISNLAVDSMQGKRMYETQNLILKNIEAKRNSISGVNYNEEMTNMVKLQHTYAASARMITTMDTIMDVTINRLGLVGR